MHEAAREDAVFDGRSESPRLILMIEDWARPRHMHQDM
jgi:hypothetical protein